MQMDAGLDTGPVLHRARMPLDGTDTGGSLHDRPPGAVLASDGGIDVATGCSVLRLLELQPPGKRRMSAAEFLRARCLPENLSGRPGGAS
jgi:methionyl-tRNA formyltransferase